MKKPKFAHCISIGIPCCIALYSGGAIAGTDEPSEKREPASWTAPTSPSNGNTPPLVTQPSTSTPAPSASPGLTFSGFLDSYIGYNFNSPQPSGSNTGLQPLQNFFHSNDLYSNSFQLNMVEFSIQKKTKDINFRLDLDFGPYADWVSNGGTGTSEQILKHVGQGYASWTPTSMPTLTVNVGKMATFIGYEAMKTKDNFNYSRSLLFQLGVPFYHVGANAALAVIPDHLTVAVHLYNAYNNIYSINSGKEIGLQVTLLPTTSQTLNLNFLTGPQNSLDNTDGTNLFNLNYQYVVNSSLTVALDTVYGVSALTTGPTPFTYLAAEILAKWAFSPGWYLSPRVEYFGDPKGVVTGATAAETLTEGTLTAGYSPTEGAEFRLEGRIDSSSLPLFIAKSTQPTVTLGFLYAF